MIFPGVIKNQLWQMRVAGVWVNTCETTAYARLLAGDADSVRKCPSFEEPSPRRIDLRMVQDWYKAGAP